MFNQYKNVDATINNAFCYEILTDKTQKNYNCNFNVNYDDNKTGKLKIISPIKYNNDDKITISYPQKNPSDISTKKSKTASIVTIMTGVIILCLSSAFFIYKYKKNNDSEETHD
jgi:hypothetical protein